MDNKKTTFKEKFEAYKQLQEFRKQYATRTDLDYKKELMEYLDERYLKEHTKNAIKSRKYRHYKLCN